MLCTNLKFNSLLLGTVLILITIGILMIYSASSFKALEGHGDSHYYLKTHFYQVVLGLLLMFIVARVDYRLWLNISPVLLIISLGALLFVLGSADNIRGSRTWISLWSLQIQPSHFAKIALILFLSASLVKKSKTNTVPYKRFLFHLFVTGLIVIPILLQPDGGTATLIVLLSVMLLFIAGEKLKYLLALGLTGMPLILIFIMREGYQKTRIMKFISSLEGDAVHWQAQQSLIALGNGHLFGLGLGGSKQKYDFLPAPFTDFIFAIIGEELGFLGTSCILIFLGIFIWIGFKIARSASTTQGGLLAAGIVTNIAICSVANISIAINLLPATGMSLPFLSYGGSALVGDLFMMGVLFNISNHVHTKSKLYYIRE